MASIRERRDKSGRLTAYLIRVYRGRGADGKQLKPFTTTFPVSPTWKESSARKKAEAYAAQIEKDVREGLRADSRIRFDKYSEYVLQIKAQKGVKTSTLAGYRTITKRIYPVLGHLKIADIRVDHLNTFYADLAREGTNKLTGKPLSAKTIREVHRLISTVLQQALKERLVTVNVARLADPPHVERKEVNHFQPEEVAAILDAAEDEPLKWRTLVHMLAITGCRRGELLGLRWANVDFDANQLFINNSVLYTPDRGVYEDTPKTEKSRRYIAMPSETMELLKTFKESQTEEYIQNGIPQPENGFVFAQPDGKPMHPDSVTNFLTKFGKRHNLPHLNAHAFRHTVASMLFYNGVDPVSVSARLGHAQVSTTADVYAHVIETADTKNAEILSDVFLKKR